VTPSEVQNMWVWTDRREAGHIPESGQNNDWYKESYNDTKVIAMANWHSGKSAQSP